MEFGKLIRGEHRDSLPYAIILLALIIMICLAFKFEGTGDDGDSINHFLHAHYAFSHPESFFDHWAKPLYVLLASPWAYWGFTGVKLFNISCLTVSMIFTYRCAVLMNIKNAWLAPLILMFLPAVITLSLSGLTEPLFSAWGIVGIYFLIRNKNIAATVWLSFLPFVRSEGLIVISVIVLYLLISKKWRFIPLLIVGHIVYGFAGLIYFDSPLWVFHNIPYAHLSTPYGVGKWFHFYKEMHLVTGVYLSYLLRICMVIAFIRMLLYWFKPQKYPFSKEELWLVYGVFSAVLIGHTIFWALGIFWSYGLLRVFVGVAPAMALIYLGGVNYLGELANRWKSYAYKIVIGLFIIFGGYNLYASLHPAQFELSASQVLLNKVAEKYGRKWLEEKPLPVLYYNAPYLAMVLPERFNYFDHSIRKYAANLYDGSPLPEHFYYIWDPSYSFYESGGPISKAFSDKRFELVSNESEYDHFYAETRNVYIFTKDTSSRRVKGILYSFEKDSNLTRFEKSAEYANQRVLKVDKDNQYSLGLSEYSRLIVPMPEPIRIKTSFKVKTSSYPRNDWENAKLVYSIDTNGKNTFWMGYSIQPRLTNTDQWQEFEQIQVLPLNRNIDDKVGVIVWNPNPGFVLIKDFKVELLE